MTGAFLTDLVHDASYSRKAVWGFSFCGRDGRRSLLAWHASHSWERMGTGTDFNDTWASGEGHGQEAGHYLDGAYPGVYLIPRNTA
jgi:hypothetical protein